MKKIIFISLILIFSLFHLKISAEPSLFSSTGIVNIPTADTINFKGFNFAVARLEGEKENNKRLGTHIYCINYGIIENLEIGGGSIEKDSSQIKGITILQAKYRIVKETTTNPNLSVGVIYASRGKKDNPQQEQVSVYVAVSQNLSWPEKFAKKFGIRATLGIGNEILDGVFAGIELKIGEHTKIFCEYDTTDYNFLLRQNLTPSIIGEIIKREKDFGLGIVVQIR